VWPLFCETDRAVDCFTSGRFLPIACLHAFFYYGGFLAVLLLKAAGRYPRLPGAGATWNKASYVGWHVPNIVHGGVYGWVALCLAWELWLTGDAKRMWGPITQHAAVDVGTWFMVFVSMDTVLSILHGDMDTETAIHHGIFGVIGLVIISECSCVFLAMNLIGQELSTPPLNIFMILRAHRGVESIWTQAFFALFALGFFATRVFINSAVTLLFLREVGRGVLGGRSELTFSAPVQLLLSVAVVAGATLQLRWGWLICKKLRDLVHGDLDDLVESPRASPTKAKGQ